MGLPILIIGRSGTGKSTSVRNMENVLICNVNDKRLPFKQKENQILFNCNDYGKIKQILLKSKEKGYNTIIVDDAGYLITQQFMSGHSACKGNSMFDLYNSLGDNFYNFITFIVKQLPADQIVYIMMHEDTNEFGNIKPKTIGKMLDEKVCVEGMFSIVLKSTKINGKYQFCTNTDGLDCTKSPMGMFENELIDNDLAVVDKTIREYYQLNNKGEEK